MYFIYKKQLKTIWITPVPSYTASDFEATLEIEALPEYNPVSQALDIVNGAVVVISLSANVLLATATAAKLTEINAYDTSDAVNSFTLGGKTLWLDSATRSKFKMSLEASKALGAKEIPLVLPQIGLDVGVNVTVGLSLLAQLEVYAAQCSIATKRHEMAVNALTDPEAVMGYDHKTNYPEKLTFSI